MRRAYRTEDRRMRLLTITVPSDTVIIIAKTSEISVDVRIERRGRSDGVRRRINLMVDYLIESRRHRKTGGGGCVQRPA